MSKAILKRELGTVIALNREFESVEVEIDSDKHITCVDKSRCRKFKPKIGDKVTVVVTDIGWYVEKR